MKKWCESVWDSVKPKPAYSYSKPTKWEKLATLKRIALIQWEHLNTCISRNDNNDMVLSVNSGRKIYS